MGLLNALSVKLRLPQHTAFVSDYVQINSDAFSVFLQIIPKLHKWACKLSKESNQFKIDSELHDVP